MTYGYHKLVTYYIPKKIYEYINMSQSTFSKAIKSLQNKNIIKIINNTDKKNMAIKFKVYTNKCIVLNPFWEN
jgi:DNA-binding MarR family transcriptional regulator